MNRTKILKEMSEILSVTVEDVPKTLRRFQKEIEELS
tara:strand:- start:1899 stop:2009 length:111 start_codon:yes stop_codon:yes gene_type:complete